MAPFPVTKDMGVLSEKGISIAVIMAELDKYTHEEKYAILTQIKMRLAADVVQVANIKHNEKRNRK